MVFASWDAEEYGLIGSTEYGEDFAEWLAAHAVAYVNVDVSAGGARWGAGGSPSLAHLIKRTAQDIPYLSATGKTLWDARDAVGPLAAGEHADPEFMFVYDAAETRRRAAKAIIPPLGSGSDFTVFLERLGVGLFTSPSFRVVLIDSTRSQARMRASPARRRTRCTTTIVCMTIRGGRPCTRTPGFIAPSVVHTRALLRPTNLYDIRRRWPSIWG